MNFQYITALVRVIEGPDGDRVEVFHNSAGDVEVAAVDDGAQGRLTICMPPAQALCVAQAITDTAREKQREAESGVGIPRITEGELAGLRYGDALAIMRGERDGARMEARDYSEANARLHAEIGAWRDWASKHVGDAGRADGEQRSLIEKRFSTRFAPCRSVGEVLSADAPVAEPSLIDQLRAEADKHQKSRPGLSEAARDLADRLAALEPVVGSPVVGTWFVTVSRAGESLGMHELGPDTMLKIGKLKHGSHICLDAEGVARMHAVIERVGDGATLIDLGSSYGTKVNGALVDKNRRLTNGDMIDVGPFRLLITRSEST